MRATITCLLILTLALAPLDGDAQEIERIEPPFWWTGFEHSEMQLMLQGNNLSLLTPTIDHPGISINRVVRVASPNYLFVYLALAENVEPGTFDIVFREGDFEITQSYELRPMNPDPDHARGFTPADAMLLITPDRFANGDPNNDEFYFLDDKLDREDPFGRHGGDLQGISEHLDYIENMGFTSVWLNPVLENAGPVASYHGYAATDLYRVDPRFGTNEQYRQLTADMRERGIGMVMDQILNHIGRSHWWMDDLPTEDWLNFPDADVFTQHRRTVNMDPNASGFDKQEHLGGWFSPGMPDLNQQNPLVADYLVQNSIWWIEYLGLQGIRLDTLPYPDKHFVTEWSRRIMAEYPHFSIVGEEWSELPAVTSYWQRGKQNADGYETHISSVFDFPVQAELAWALTGDPESISGVWINLYETVAQDFLYPERMDIVVFPGNHDMDRIYTRLDEQLDLFKMAMVFVATMRGIPQFFYADEILASHPGTSSHGELRSDFPGGWQGDTINAFTGEGLTGEQLEAQAFVSSLLNWRKENPTIHNGDFMHFAPVRNVYVYFRYDEAGTIMVVLNRDENPVELETARFAERIGDAASATDALSGRQFELGESIALQPRSALILELE